MSPVPPMTWKSTALLTGVTALATWLASPPATAPPAASSRARMPAQAQVSSATSSAIETEAARLSARSRPSASSTTPKRDPFQFETRGGNRVAASKASPAASPGGPEPLEFLRAWPVVTLTGVATDVVAGAPQRTAIFSSREGVLLVREGETVLDRYRVTRIDADGVEIERVEDGASRRISLAP